MKGRLQSCSHSRRERKEPSRAGCYASLQPWTALGNVSHPPKWRSEELGKRHGPSAPERGLSLPPRAPRFTESAGPRDAAAAKGLQRTARHLRPDGLMSADSAILPSGFLRPLIPALEPPQRGPTRRSRLKPWLIPAGCGTRRVRGASAGKNGRRVAGTRTELPARSVWLGQTRQRSHGLAGPDES